MVRALGGDAAARRAIEESGLQEERLVQVLDAALVLAGRRRQRLETDGTPVVLLDDRAQEFPVHALEAGLVDPEPRQGVPRDLDPDRAVPFDLGEALSNHDVAQPDLLFVSNSRSEIVTDANIQGGPDLLVEIISPGTAQYDRGYKQLLYGRHGVLEYWMVDPDALTVEVMVQEDEGLTPWAVYRRGETMSSRLLQGLSIDLEQIFEQTS